MDDGIHTVSEALGLIPRGGGIAWIRIENEALIGALFAVAKAGTVRLARRDLRSLIVGENGKGEVYLIGV